MPHSEKLVAAELIVKNSSYAILKNEETGEMKKTNRIKINSPMRYILFVMTVIDKYTNLKVNFKDVLPEYDYLNKNGLIEIIFNKIGDKEVGTYVGTIKNDDGFAIGGAAAYANAPIGTIVKATFESDKDATVGLFAEVVEE